MPDTMRRSAAVAAGALLTALVTDLVTKAIILDRIGPGTSRRSIEVVGELLQFTFVRNTGSAFGLFQGNSQILTFAALGAMIVLVMVFARNARRDPWFALAIGLQLGGAFGNLADRIRHGYVVDFIDVPRFPTFNVADIAITCGVTLMAYCLLFRDEAVNAQRQVSATTSTTTDVTEDV